MTDAQTTPTYRSITDIVKSSGSYDLGGETVLGGMIRGIHDVEIHNGVVLGMLEMRDCNAPWLHNLISEGGNVVLQGLLNINGGERALIEDCILHGGYSAGQLHVGRGSLSGSKACPINWTIRRVHCSGNGPWDEQPRAHCTYFNTLPGIDMKAVVEDCYFEQAGGHGYVYKVGGTEFYPWQEGSNGILTRRCTIVSAPGSDGRALPIVCQGMGTRNIVFEDIDITMVHSDFGIEYGYDPNVPLPAKAMDVINLTGGAQALCRNVRFVQGAEQYTTAPKSFLFWKWFASDKRLAKQNVNGLKWEN